MDLEEEAPLCVHGNPNVLTRDIGTSSFARGCTGELTTVEVERFNGNLSADSSFLIPSAGRAGFATFGIKRWVLIPRGKHHLGLTPFTQIFRPFGSDDQTRAKVRTAAWDTL